MEKEDEKWFKNWFDTKYYHLLYSNRNQEEARLFIEKLIDELKPQKEAKILDIACGKGRHAMQLSTFGYDVTGIDLSEQSIDYAKNFEKENLHFHVHDMREVFKENSFDICLNLFTSFGYFLKKDENQKAIMAMAENLKKNGTLVLDYLNVEKALQSIPDQNNKQVKGIDFHIEKKEWNNFIRKTIKFDVEGEQREYHEYVKIITKTDFYNYFENAGLKVKQIYGDYQLKPFDEKTSERLIFLAEKI